MTYRTIASVVLALIISAELFVYIKFEPEPSTKTIEEVTFLSEGGTGFSQFRQNRQTKTITLPDDTNKRDWNNKFLFIVGSTLVVGCISIFSLPNQRIKLE